jgi:hypothetical protein
MSFVGHAIACPKYLASFHYARASDPHRDEVKVRVGAYSDYQISRRTQIWPIPFLWRPKTKEFDSNSLLKRRQRRNRKIGFRTAGFCPRTWEFAPDSNRSLDLSNSMVSNGYDVTADVTSKLNHIDLGLWLGQTQGSHPQNFMKIRPWLHRKRAP